MIGGIDQLRIPNLSCCEPICGAFLRTLVRLTADARRLTIHKSLFFGHANHVCMYVCMYGHHI